jgi:hypothetical protein
LSWAGSAAHVGEHSTEILREAGYKTAEIEALLADGVTVDAAKGRYRIQVAMTIQ